MGRLALRAILTPGTGAAAIRSGPFRVRVTKGKKGPVLRAALSGGSSSQGRKVCISAITRWPLLEDTELRRW